MGLHGMLSRNPIIAGIRQAEQLQSVAEADLRIAFLLAGTILTVSEAVTAAKHHDIALFTHLDLLRGIGKDPEGVEFLARMGVQGIVTTRSHLIKAAKRAGLFSIQRLFLLDSEALKTGVQVVESAKPDAVEILPGLVFPYVADLFQISDFPPIIAGGLVRNEGEAKRILAAGAMSISTSAPALWSPSFWKKEV